MINKPKIVAPGWSYNKAIVASKYWADEVYVWVPFTSLRMRQNKIESFDDLQKTVDAVRWNWSKVLLTMNIFPRNTDIKVFESVVEKISDVNPDAIIFSDPGTFNIIRKYLPNTPLHLSTQTSTLNYESIRFWYDLGVKRVVLARELHIDEIKEIKEKIPEMELEIFVHWAMCMSYSGRCLLGDYMSGRQANKWECSHACRFKYKVRLEEERRPWKMIQLQWDENGSHILSSKDLCAIDRLEEIIPYVDALKIEWRSKSEFYVWSVVKAYKHVRDQILLWKKINPEIKNLVNVVPHREYRDWFLFNKLQDYPEWESVIASEWNERGDLKIASPTARNDQTISTTLDSAWPLFNRNYFWVFTDQYIENNWKKYFEIDPKEVIEPNMEIKYISPGSIGTLKILDIIDKSGNSVEKATCNTPWTHILTDKDLSGREILYK